MSGFGKSRDDSNESSPERQCFLRSVSQTTQLFKRCGDACLCHFVRVHMRARSSPRPRIAAGSRGGGSRACVVQISRHAARPEAATCSPKTESRDRLSCIRLADERAREKRQVEHFGSGKLSTTTGIIESRCAKGGGEHRIRQKVLEEPISVLRHLADNTVLSAHCREAVTGMRERVPQGGELGAQKRRNGWQSNQSSAAARASRKADAARLHAVALADDAE